MLTRPGPRRKWRSHDQPAVCSAGSINCLHVSFSFIVDAVSYARKSATLRAESWFGDIRGRRAKMDQTRNKRFVGRGFSSAVIAGRAFKSLIAGPALFDPEAFAI